MHFERVRCQPVEGPLYALRLEEQPVTGTRHSGRAQEDLPTPGRVDLRVVLPGQDLDDLVAAGRVALRQLDARWCGDPGARETKFAT